MAGFFLRPDLYVNEHGEIFLARDDGLGGLGKINWDKVGDFFKPIVTGVATRLTQPKQTPEYYAPTTAPGGAYVGASSGSLFGGIDTTTLLLIGGAVLLFMSRPGGRH